MKRILNLNLSQFQKLLALLGKEETYEYKLDYYTDLICLVNNKSVDAVEDMDFEQHKVEFTSCLEELNNLNDYNEMPNELRIGNIVYHTNAVVDSFGFKTKEFRLIQSIIGNSEYISNFAAIIWTESKNYSEVDIKKRRDIFVDSMKVSHILGYINKFSTYLS